MWPLNIEIMLGGRTNNSYFANLLSSLGFVISYIAGLIVTYLSKHSNDTAILVNQWEARVDMFSNRYKS